MYTWLWSYIKKYGFLMLGGLLLVLVTGGLNLVNPLLSGRLVDDVIIGGNIPLMWKILAFMMGTVIVKTLIRYGFQMIFENISQGVIKKIRTDLFALMQNLDFSFHDTTKTGDLMALMTGDINTLRHFIAWVIYQVFENSCLFIISIIALFFINPFITLCLLTVTPVIAIAAITLSKKVLPTFGAIRDQFSRLNSAAQENIGGNRVVRAFVREKYEMEKMEKESLAFLDRNMESAAVWAKYIPVIEFFSGLLTVALVLSGGILIINGKLTMGEFVTFNSLIWAINQPLRMTGWLINDVQRFVASCRRLHELSLVKPHIQDIKDARRVPSDSIKGTVVFEKVNFSYSGDSRNTVLHDIDFTVESGQTIGIVGPTGSGKSTIARLLCRFYDPDSGRILLDGHDIRTLPLEQLRSVVGISMQDVFLYSDTLEGNIAFGRPDMSMDEVLSASRLASTHGFISRLPQKYDTVVGERGIGLSGGQRQRVALARLLATSPPVLILDDTTSAVDVETEEKLQKSVKTLHGKCTMIIIAHRISSIKHADCILVIQDGRITQKGRHDELLKQDGLYAEVCRHQAGVEE